MKAEFGNTPMSQYRLLAADYDGTLATEGTVDPATLEALQRWKSTGRQLVLITGRQFDDLLRTFSALDLFDLAVLENGAMLYHPQEKREQLLAAPPPQEFIDRLCDRIACQEHPPKEARKAQAASEKDRSAVVGVGRVIVATWVPHDSTAQALIDELALDLQIIMNKRAVMILPKGISKESGLNAALRELGIAAHEVVGVGDAENDADFLKFCGYSVAVANALPSLKEQVNWVTLNSRGRGVVELINQLLGE